MDVMISVWLNSSQTRFFCTSTNIKNNSEHQSRYLHGIIALQSDLVMHILIILADDLVSQFQPGETKH